MKKQICLLIAMTVLLSFYSSAQTGVRIGIKAGYAMATQYGIDVPDIPYTVKSDSRHGFTGAFMLYFPITESFGVQNEWAYSTKGSQQSVTMHNLPVSTVSDYKLNYFEMPIVFRYTFAKIKDVGIYLNSGFAMSLMMSGDYTINTTVDMGGGPMTSKESGDMKGVDTFDYSFIYGAGLDFNFLNQDWFFEFRQTFGWNTLMMPNVEGQEGVPLRNQNYTFSLGILL